MTESEAEARRFPGPPRTDLPKPVTDQRPFARGGQGIQMQRVDLWEAWQQRLQTRDKGLTRARDTE